MLSIRAAQATMDSRALRTDPPLALTRLPSVDFTGGWASAISRQLFP